jgi:hypothetical protein
MVVVKAVMLEERSLEGREFFAKWSEYLGSWRIIRWKLPEGVGRTAFRAESGMVNKSVRGSWLVVDASGGTAAKVAACAAVCTQVQI